MARAAASSVIGALVQCAIFSFSKRASRSVGKDVSSSSNRRYNHHPSVSIYAVDALAMLAGETAGFFYHLIVAHGYKICEM
jgi:hypothetical protein